MRPKNEVRIRPGCPNILPARWFVLRVYRTTGILNWAIGPMLPIVLLLCA